MSRSRLSDLKLRRIRDFKVLRSPLDLNFGQTEQEDSALNLLQTEAIKSVGPELILGAIFDKIGFNTIPDDLFKEIV